MGTRAAAADTASPRIARRRQRMRGALLAAASRQFASRGSAAVRVEELIAEADVSRATFYRFFPNKYSLLEELLNPIFEEALALLQRHDASPPAAGLDALIGVYWQLWSRHRDGMLLIPLVDGETFRHFAGRHAALNEALARILVRAEKADLLRNGSAQYSLKVIARTAIPLLRVFDGHPAGEALFRDALNGLLLRTH